MQGQFKYDAKGKDFFSLLFIQMLLTMITCGIYYPWAIVKIAKYLYSKTGYGGKTFNFEASGGDLFILILKGTILTSITCGIYYAWFLNDLIKFVANSSSIK